MTLRPARWVERNAEGPTCIAYDRYFDIFNRMGIEVGA